MYRTFIMLIVAILIAASTNCAFAQTTGLFAWDTDTPNESLWTVDPTGPTATLVGPALGNEGVIAEIEYANGVIYGSDTAENTNLRVIDPSTGNYISTLTMTFPVLGNVITSMEFINGVLYGGLTTEVGGTTTYLSTIDTNSGAVNVVGSLTATRPLGGLAYNGTTLYGVTAGGSAAQLLTIDLATGAPISSTAITLDGNSVNLTALEFGLDGQLYSLNSAFGANPLLANHLYVIDPATGVATDLGNVGGATRLVALTTAVPEPSSLVVMAIGGLAMLARRRR